MLKYLLLIILCFSSFGAFAYDASENNFCATENFPQQKEFEIVKIIGEKNQKAYFHTDHTISIDCDNTGQKYCRTKQYLLSGDKAVKAQDSNDGYSCVAYQHSLKSKITVGWIKTDQLESTNPDIPAFTDWVGNWAFSNNKIKITLARKILNVNGSAVWYNNNPDPNIGEINDSGKPKGNRLSLGEDLNKCHVDLTLIGNLLLVYDNSKCGNWNNSFTEIYRRN